MRCVLACLGCSNLGRGRADGKIEEIEIGIIVGTKIAALILFEICKIHNESISRSLLSET